ncbi:MAG: 6-phosphogluconolactonase [Acidimicrobiia bacterium]|nr:6-phosphogluconolactonase [Acidimicrobiia bacterium]MDH3470784.1 6-phosphogluconolactonase [Acidimicrobiia bacterium]
MATDVRISDDTDALADLAAATIARWLREGTAPITLGLAGGSTPRATYLRLRDEDIDWAHVLTWMSDERWVPPSHQDRNDLMAHGALLDQVNASFVPLQWLPADPQAAAADYNVKLSSIFGDSQPTVILLGLGDDGHTASLFPNTDALDERIALFVSNWVEEKQTWRLTATMPLLWRASHLAFLVSGESKAGVMAQILQGGSGLPAEAVADGANQVTWFLDSAAASQL